MEKLISESTFYEAIYKLPIRGEKADGENHYYLVSIADIFEMLEKLPANNSEKPNSSDTISRAKAIDAVMECYDNDELFEVYEDKLRELPPAQPKRIRGHWNKKMSIRHINGAVCYIPKWHCPKCDLEYDPYFAQQVNFCYACGQWIEGLVDDVNEVTE